MLAVGFVDLVDFTRTSGRLDEAGLGNMLSRFESLAWDAVIEAGGRLVKLIGDEAMLVCPTAAQAAAALEIVEASARRPDGSLSSPKAICSRREQGWRSGQSWRVGVSNSASR